MDNLKVVKAKAGKFIGINTDGVNIWKGIKYAKTPIGKDRFTYSKKLDYIDNYEAFEFKAICPQNDHYDYIHDEDCLHLNIWANEKADKRPVLFYIHGGSFMGGTSREPYEEGSVLARERDVVVVTIEYRLNVFGMLDFSFLDDKFKPNCGIKDCIDALKWTYENIEYFGGDKDNITIMGESAGGSIVSALTNIDIAKPYINKAIITSGIPASFMTKEESISVAKKYMEYMNISTKEELLNLDYRYIEKYITGFTKYTNRGYSTYLPCIDKKLIKDIPIIQVKNGDAKKIPMVVGMTKDELCLLNLPSFDRAWNMQGLMEAGFKKEKGITIDRLEKFYRTFYGEKAWRGYFYSDAIIRTSLLWYAEEISDYMDIWVWRLDWSPNLMERLGVYSYHSSDLYYIFGNVDSMIGARFMNIEEKIDAKLVSSQIQDDLLEFLETDSLYWAKYSREKPLAKCYDVNSFYGEIIPKAFMDIWKTTNYYNLVFKKED